LSQSQIERSPDGIRLCRWFYFNPEHDNFDDDRTIVRSI